MREAADWKAPIGGRCPEIRLLEKGAAQAIARLAAATLVKQGRAAEQETVDTDMELLGVATNCLGKTPTL